MFRIIWQFICKILILEYWSTMAARIWSNNSDTILTCWSKYKFQFFVGCSHLFFHLFLPRSRFSFLTFIKFPIYPRLLYFNPGWNFSYNCNFFNSVYRTEISTRDENLHIISPLDGVYTWNFIPEWNSSRDEIMPVYVEMPLTVYTFFAEMKFDPGMNSSLSKRQGWNFIPRWKKEKKTCKHFIPGWNFKMSMLL